MVNKIILFFVSVSLSIAQLNVEPHYEFSSSNGKEYFNLVIEVTNNHNNDIVLYIQNWRFSLVEEGKSLIGFPVMPNLVNKVVLRPKSSNIYDEYLGEDSNHGKLDARYFKIVKPDETFRFIVTIKDSEFCESAKGSSHDLDFIYSYTFYKDLNEYLSKHDYPLLYNDKEYFIINEPVISSQSVRSFDVRVYSEDSLDKEKTLPDLMTINNLFNKYLYTIVF